MAKFILHKIDGTSEAVNAKDLKTLKKSPKGKAKNVKAISVISAIGEAVLYLVRIIRAVKK